MVGFDKLILLLSVLICHNWKSIFIHIPKCAGTLFRRELAQQAPFGSTISFWEFSYQINLRRYVDLAHLPLADLRHFSEWELLNRYHTIAVVRNPYDRLASACVEYYRHKSPETYKQMLTEPPSREQLLAYLRALPQGLECRDLRYVHAFPMIWFTHYGNEPMIDILLRCEHLEHDIRLVCEQGILPPKLLEILTLIAQQESIVNKSCSSKLRNDSDLQALANILYQEDFTTFNYDRLGIDFSDSHLADLAKSLREIKSHQIQHLSYAPRVLWHWGRSCNMLLPYMLPTRNRQ